MSYVDATAEYWGWGRQLLQIMFMVISPQTPLHHKAAEQVEHPARFQLVPTQSASLGRLTH